MIKEMLGGAGNDQVGYYSAAIRRLHVCYLYSANDR